MSFFFIYILIDSNTFHAVCMDTQPPLFYLNEKSKQVIALVNHFNAKFGAGKALVAYTFDAGPNAFLFVEDINIIDLVYVIYRLYFAKFALLSANEFIEKYVILNISKGFIQLDEAALRNHKENLDEFCRSVENNLTIEANSIKQVIHSKVGDEPRVYDFDKFCLLSDSR